MPLPAALPDGLIIEPEGSGISRPLSRQVNLLGAILGRAIRAQFGKDILDLVERLRRLCKQGSLDKAAEAIQEAETDDLLAVLRAFTTFFHLVNKAEQVEIVRINRERARAATADNPRTESVAAAVYQLKRQRKSLNEVLDLIGKIDIQPTFTAHPTEARRRTILLHQQRIASHLEAFRDRELTPEETDGLVRDIEHSIRLMLTTDEVRPSAVTVKDEVRQGLYFLGTSVWNVVPRIHADLRRALRTHYPEGYGKDAPRLPAFLRYRSWIGGDRDGNPNVTPELTRWALREHRKDALLLHHRALDELRLTLSVSDQRVNLPDDLYESIEADRQRVDLPERRWRQNAHEPIRLKLMLMQAKLQRELKREEASSYNARAYRDDLNLVADSLAAAGLEELTRDGPLADLIVQAAAFGFHLAALDIRQHSAVHERAVAEILKTQGIKDDYTTLDEGARDKLLLAQLNSSGDLRISFTNLSEETRTVLDTLEVVREAVDREPRSIGSYIISMTDAVSDVLEVLYLARVTGLWRLLEDGRVESSLDVVPLLETISDLEASGDFLEDLFSHSVYKRQLKARGGMQEVMLGYSDSNKDGGYWMANCALHRAQEDVARTCNRFGVELRLFHGRGGTVGRGGGRANQAISALPPDVQNGRIRFTEQGEVISFRYSLEDIARRHLEQIVHAQMEALGASGRDASDDPVSAHLVQRIAESSMAAYRELIDSEDFWTWYLSVTPIEYLAEIPMGSRPVSRRSTEELEFEDLRAIPWVFGWTQTRYTAPGWYGIGRAFEDLGGDLVLKLKHVEDWPFLRAVVDNALREMARARFEVAGRYAAQSDAPIHDRLAEEFERAKRALLALSGQNSLLENNPVIQKSIELRNPYTDVLNLAQIELMQRLQSDPIDQAVQATTEHALYVSVNGIAAAMQSTG